jgi:hypothetical protein
VQPTKGSGCTPKGCLIVGGVVGFLVIGLVAFVALFAPSTPRTAPTPSQSNPPSTVKEPVGLKRRCGTPDRDTSSQFENSRPPIVTRIVEYRSRGLRIVYLADAPMGSPPPYSWKFIGASDIPSNKLISMDELQQRLTLIGCR